MSATEYNDSLVIIDDMHIVVKNYFLNGNDRRVAFNDIKSIEEKQPSLWNGKWRLSGTGDLRTWFASDSSRFSRDKIFIIKIINKWWRVGFTVEDSGRVEEILKNKKLLKSE